MPVVQHVQPHTLLICAVSKPVYPPSRIFVLAQYTTCETKLNEFLQYERIEGGSKKPRPTRRFTASVALVHLLRVACRPAGSQCPAPCGHRGAARQRKGTGWAGLGPKKNNEQPRLPARASQAAVERKAGCRALFSDKHSSCRFGAVCYLSCLRAKLCLSYLKNVSIFFIRLFAGFVCWLR